MTTDNDDNDNMKNALKAVPDGPLYIAHELRLMADAEDPYTDRSYTPAMIKNIWRAAADYLEHAHIGTKH